MNKQQAAQMIPVMQAWVDGKQIQYRSSYTKNVWTDAKPNSSLGFMLQRISEYRIKPEPRMLYEVVYEGKLPSFRIYRTLKEAEDGSKYLLSVAGGNGRHKDVRIIKYMEVVE